MSDSQVPTPSGGYRPARVLVCDDDADARRIVAHTLSAAGFIVVESEDADAAIEECGRLLPDVIVMDIMMKGTTGLEFVSWLRKEIESPFVPVLLLTALTDIEDLVQGLELGADDYLTKPFNYRELQARVGALLRLKDLTDSLNDRTKQLEAANEELSRIQAELLQKERELVTAQLAGAAAHHLGQPITTIALNCDVIERLIGDSGEEKIKGCTDAIKKECKSVQDILSKLRIADPNQTQDYPGDTKILDIESS